MIHINLSDGTKLSFDLALLSRKLVIRQASATGGAQSMTPGEISIPLADLRALVEKVQQIKSVL